MRIDVLLKTAISFSILMIFVSIANGQGLAKAEHSETLSSNIIENDNYTEIIADSLIKFACNYLKTPYKLGATGTKSFDCSGFSSYIYSKFGYSLNRTAQEQANRNGIEVPRDSLMKGDLVFFKGRNAKKERVGHVGIVYEVLPDGNFRFIHASCKYGVTITEGNKAYYNTRFVKAKRIIDEESIENIQSIFSTKKEEDALLF